MTLAEDVYDRFTDIVLLDDPNTDKTPCIVCQSDFSFPEKRIQCECKAFAHTQCIFRWMERKRQCPQCNSDLVDSKDWIEYFFKDEARADLDEGFAMDIDDMDDNWDNDELPSRYTHPTLSDENPFEQLVSSPMPYQHVKMLEHILNYIEDNYDQLDAAFFYDSSRGTVPGASSETDLVVGHHPHTGPAV